MTHEHRISWMMALVPAALVIIAGCGSSKSRQMSIQPTGPAPILEDITPVEARDMILARQGDADFVLLDIRTPEEFAAEHLEGAVEINYRAPTFGAELDQLDKGKTYLIYCRTGHRTGMAGTMMRAKGFARVYNMLGGITRWKTEGLPVAGTPR